MAFAWLETAMNEDRSNGLQDPFPNSKEPHIIIAIVDGRRPSKAYLDFPSHLMLSLVGGKDIRADFEGHTSFAI